MYKKPSFTYHHRFSIVRIAQSWNKHERDGLLDKSLNEMLWFITCSEMEALVLELNRVVVERDSLAAQIKADAVAMSDRIHQATQQGEACSITS